MAIDSNPRHFFLDVTKVEANVDASEREDFITFEFAGTVTPTLKKRIEFALANGRYEITVKRFG